MRPRLENQAALEAADPVLLREKVNAAAEQCRRALSEGESAAFEFTLDGRAARELVADSKTF